MLFLNHPFSRAKRALARAFLAAILLPAAASLAAAQAPAFTDLVTFTGGATDAASPDSGLILGTDGNLYGMSSGGGPVGHAYGTIFKVTPMGVKTILHFFNGMDGTGAYVNGWSRPPLLWGSDGNVYAATDAGTGEVSKITPGGAFTVLHTFTGGSTSGPGTDGGLPLGSLTLGQDGSVYGTTNFLTADNHQYYFGTIFKIAPGGTYSMLRAFTGLDGAWPTGRLTLGNDGNLYGVTTGGGGLTNSGQTSAIATIYKITPSGDFTVLYSSDTQTSNLEAISELTKGGDGNFYGTMRLATNNPNSSLTIALIFKITPSGTFTILYSMTTANEFFGDLTLGSDGNLYGTIEGSDLVFKITPAGVFTTSSLAPGYGDATPLLQASDGYLYGTSAGGGTGSGLVYRVDHNLAVTILHTFNGVDGAQPAPYLAQMSDGGICGTAVNGGANKDGVVFKIYPTGQTLVSMSITPPSASITAWSTEQCTLATKDTFGNPMATQPPATWSVSGGGTISANGLFHAAGKAGTFTVTAVFGSFSSTATITIVAPIVDFNGDGKTDLVLQNSASYLTAAWYMNGPTVLGGQYLSTETVNPWHVLDAGDFNGDGKTDLLLRNPTTNQLSIWTMNGVAVTGMQTLIGTAPGNVVAVRDFNGDGKADIVYQNAASNKVFISLMNGAALVSTVNLGTVPPAGWTVVGSGDFNYDGLTDLVLQNATTHQIALWYLNGGTVIGGAYTSITPGAGWKVAATGDYNGDGRIDLVLQNATTNQIAFWYLNGATVTGGAYASVTPAAKWNVVGPR